MGYVADTQFSLVKRQQDSQPGGIAKQLVEFRQLMEAAFLLSQTRLDRSHFVVFKARDIADVCLSGYSDNRFHRVISHFDDCENDSAGIGKFQELTVPAL